MDELMRNCLGTGAPDFGIDSILEIANEHNRLASALDRRVHNFVQQLADAILECSSDCSSIDAVAVKFRRTRFGLVAEAKALLQTKSRLLDQIESKLRELVDEAISSIDTAADGVERSLHEIGLSAELLPGWHDNPVATRQRFRASHVHQSQAVTDLVAYRFTIEGHIASCNDFRLQATEQQARLQNWIDRQLAVALAH